MLFDDETCDSNEKWSFFNYHKKTFKKPNSTWHFNRMELNAIAMIYLKLQLDIGSNLRRELPSQSFSNVLHKTFGLADDSLIEQIFNAFQITRSISLKKWIGAISLFLRGSLKEKIDFCFKVYDKSGKNEIRRENLIKLLRSSVYKHEEEDLDEAVKDLVDMTIRKMDKDIDGIISFKDYSKTVLEDPMMLECFGHCLPDQKYVNAFLATFTDKIKKF